MAKTNLVEFNSRGKTQRGYLVLLSSDGAENTAAYILKIATTDINIRFSNPEAEWTRKTVIPKEIDENHQITAFSSRIDANLVAHRVIAKAEKLRARKSTK